MLPKQRNKAKEVYRKGEIEIGLHESNAKIVIHHMMFRPKENIPSLKVPYIRLPEENRSYQLNRKTEKKNNKEKLPVILEKCDIQSYCSLQENAYVIKYTPPAVCPHKLITIFVHNKTNKPL